MAAIRVARSLTHGHYLHPHPLGLASSPARLTGARIPLTAVNCNTFTTTSPIPNSNKPTPENTDPESSKITLKSLGATPRVRWFIRACILVVVMAETATYVKFLPKVFGKEKEKEESS